MALAHPALPTRDAVAGECSVEHTYIGQRPREGNNLGWTENTQGIAHDDANWFVSTAQTALDIGSPVSVIFRLPGSQDLRTRVCCEGTPLCGSFGGVPVKCATLETSEIGALGYDHYGDPEVYQGHLCMPIEDQQRASPHAVIAFYDTEDLHLEKWGELPTPIGAFCAIDDSGILYISSLADASFIPRYTIDWDTLEDDPEERLDIGDPLGSVMLLDEQGETLTLHYPQGAVFSEDGLLYVINGESNKTCDECGIHVFELKATGSDEPCDLDATDCDAVRIDHSHNSSDDGFQFKYDTDKRIRLRGFQEPEGITWWDLSAPGAPAMPGIESSQLHALLLENRALADDVWLKHYHVEATCSGEAGLDVTPSRVEFDDVDVGASVAKRLEITNRGDAAVLVESLTLVDDEPSPFSVESLPPLPAEVEAGSTLSADVRFTPTTGGRVTALVEIVSSAPEAPFVEVPIAGDGISLLDQAFELVDGFREVVAQGLLVGLGSGNSSDHRRDALGNMLEEAAALLEDGFVTEACGQLQAALMHTDGEIAPEDFVRGPAAVDLADEIIELRNHLGCAARRPGCGLGFELALLLPALLWLRARRRAGL